MIDKLPGSSGYKTFAYDVALLKEFVGDETRGVDERLGTGSQGGGRRRRRRGSFSRGGGSLGGSLRGSFRKIIKKKEPRGAGVYMEDSSIHSAGSLRGRRGVNTSIAGGMNLFNEIKDNEKNNPRRAATSSKM